jgi:ABC-type phosphate transport system substrate-binding protein
MSMKFKKLAVPAVTAALALAVGGAGAAGTGPKYIGGGATLPAIAYTGVTPATTTNPATPATGSALAYWLANLTATPGTSLATYCQTGSGFGKKVLNGTDDASLPCAALGTSSVDGTNGFAAPTGQKYPDFVGSDSPLSAAEYNTFVTNAGTTGSKNFGRGEPVQLPAIVGSVAIVYNNSDTSVSSLNLTNAQLCKVFDGEFTNWTQLGATTSKTIKVIYRSDGSGTTFSFANHLSSVSATTGLRDVCTGTGETYALDQTFTNVLPSPLPSGASTANFSGASGNPGVIAAVAASDGTIAYAETANVLAYNGAHTPALKLANLNSLNPTTNLPEAAYAITSSTAIVKDKAIGSYVANGRPTLTTLTPTTANCVLLVDPSKYSNPTSGYQIIGVTNLELSSAGNSSSYSGNSAVVTDLQNLGYFLSQTTSYPGVTTINQASNTAGTGTTGFSSFRLGGLTTLPATIKTAATGCVGS